MHPLTRYLVEQNREREVLREQNRMLRVLALCLGAILGIYIAKDIAVLIF